MSKLNELYNKWLQDEAYLEAYDVMEDKFMLSAALIKARACANLTQGELALRMHTTPSAVARLEGGANFHHPHIRENCQGDRLLSQGQF